MNNRIIDLTKFTKLINLTKYNKIIMMINHRIFNFFLSNYNQNK